MKWLLDNSVFLPVVMGSHTEHATSCAWLKRARPDGWGVTLETFLGVVRKLMNPVIMQGNHLTALDAIDVVRLRMAGNNPGKIIIGGQPDDALLKKAQGHGQIMDFYLVQVARDTGMKLVTRDKGILATFPAIAVYPS